MKVQILWFWIWFQQNKCENAIKKKNLMIKVKLLGGNEPRCALFVYNPFVIDRVHHRSILAVMQSIYTLNIGYPSIHPHDNRPNHRWVMTSCVSGTDRRGYRCCLCHLCHRCHWAHLWKIWLINDSVNGQFTRCSLLHPPRCFPGYSACPSCPLTRLSLSSPRVVKEEISDDNAKLPCFNGRVVSWVSEMDGALLHGS